MDYNKVYSDWLCNCTEYKAQLLTMKDEEIKSAFCTELTFGTAGLRGIMGAGTNRMNERVVRRASAGLADWLRGKCDSPSAVIAYDTRNSSRDFAEASARVLAGACIKTYRFDRPAPVPLLSFAVRNLGCDAGIVITASHNRKEYNGYKVYNSIGGQITDKDADEILAEIRRHDYLSPLPVSDDIETVPERIRELYIKSVRDTVGAGASSASVVYTPLNGSGRDYVTEVLKSMPVADLNCVEQQMPADGNFPTCPYPNPEKQEVYRLAEEIARDCGADVCIATDPDSDRAGVKVLHNGEYVLLTGNEIGTLILNYLCETAGDVSGRTLVTTIVSSPLVDRIAEAYGVSVVRTLVGFKYIGEQMELLGDRFLFGFEESNGFLAGNYTRDKDGVFAAATIARMAGYYKDQGRDLIDVLEEIYDKYGRCVCRQVSVEKDGGPIMQALRNAGAAGFGVHEKPARADAAMTDYSSGVNGLPAADILSFECGDGSRLIVRPSGTEPKVKLYAAASDDDRIDELLGIFTSITGEEL